MIVTPPPEYPFQNVVLDLFQIRGKTYIAFACYLTGWLEVASLRNSANSSDIIAVVSEWFHRFGISDELSLDKSTEDRTFLPENSLLF